MSDFLYNIFIFPLVQIIEITFVIIYRIFRDKVLAIIGVSAVVTICTMPLYFIAEKWQQTERDLQKKLKPKIDKIKSVFKGDEQYMILSAYYRQNHYHPVYALRNSLWILIQVPFFLAAYYYLSNLDYIKGTSFLFIKDLGFPDSFFSFRGFNINLLPILMTAINCASAAIYTKGFPARDKIQIYGMALIFLVLLYNSPAGLVLYWTMNNVFSLIKNILVKTRHRLKIVYVTLCLCVLFIIIRFIPVGFSPKRLFIAGFCSLIFFVPLFIRLFRFIAGRAAKIFNIEQSSLSVNSTYILSALILFMLCGLVIPGALIASSVQEFSFLDSYTTPLPFIFTVSIQSMGIFLFWPLCIYFLFSKKIKHALSLILSLICVTALVNTFLFPGNFGFITTTLRFSTPDTFESNYSGIITSGIITFFILIFFTLLLLTKRRIIFHSFQLIIFTALLFFSVFNFYKINRDFKNYETIIKSSADIVLADRPEPVYHFSRNGKNVIVFMLDSAISGYLPYIFNEKPELLQDFSGFVYYPNCVSFGSHTRMGAPLIFGGYEYEPANIQKNRSYAMGKHNEALLMMPRIFLKEDYLVTVTDPVFANYSLKPDLSVFAPYPEISARNIHGNYTGIWLRSHPDLKILSVPELLKELLIRFSFLKIAPPAFRVFIYDKAGWLKPGGNVSNNQLTLETLDSYSTLDFFPMITEISDDTVNTYTSIINELPHDSVMLQYPDYVPAMEVTDYGNNLFGDEASYYHVNMASLLLIGNWLKFLQEQGVYDNTRIIIVSDHGRGVDSNYEGNMRLPGGAWLSAFHALLLVKDFGAAGNLVTDNTFMTHGDAPLLAMNGLIENPVNPFSGNPIESKKENGVTVTTAGTLQFVISNDQWLYVKDNIFNPENWKAIKK
jgi:YidC/Oxa1 family membrane protein insertase